MSPTQEFSDEINRLRHDRLLEKAAGAVRVDLTRDSVIENWFIVINAGDISVSRESIPADAVLRAEQETFDLIASGAMNATAAIARGEVSVRAIPACPVPPAKARALRQSSPAIAAASATPNIQHTLHGTCA